MGRIELTTLLVFISYVVALICAAPADSIVQSLVVSSTEPSSGKEAGKESESAEAPPNVPTIYLMHVRSNISNRFAHTTITSKVKNVADKAQETTFAVVLPESAFISGFIMEVDGKNYTAYVKEKEEAKKDYDQAVASGFGAAHVAVSARDSNRFTVSVNIEPETKAAFYLTYEELLKREDGHYEQVINLHPGQPVKDLSVEVVITESRKIIDLKAPPLRSGNEVGNDKADLDPRADLEIVNDTAAVVSFNPNLERQKQLAHLLGTEEKDGLAGQFIVQYDVERDPKGGEVLVQDGYFVHFFAPTELAPLPKHVVFVLDTSSSMYNQKIVQLREAMQKILEQLHENDLMSLVEFNTNAKVWDLDKPEASVVYPTRGDEYPYHDKGEKVSFDDFTFPRAYPANTDNIKKAKATVSGLEPTGGTDIYTALRVGLHLVELGKAQNTEAINRQPIIVFLTDGEPTVRLTLTEEITNKIGEFNVGPRKSPIFALSFGAGADKKFLQKLALRNSGFSKHIYEAADASLQLQDFYRQISSPLLADVTFKYEPSVTSLTKTDFPIHFGGSELIVAGRWPLAERTNSLQPKVDGLGMRGRLVFQPTVEQSVSNIERLWAYLTVRQLLEKSETSDKGMAELKKKALDLALKYSFVTSVSSLVVVKPNATKAVDTEEASAGGRGRYPSYHGSFAASSGGLSSRGGIRTTAGAAHSGSHYSSFSVRTGSSRQPVFNTYQAVSYSPIRHSSSSLGLSQPSLPSVLTSYKSTSFNPTSEADAVAPTTPDLLTRLPWLNDVLSNGILSLPQGEYKLGLNETISDVVSCSTTPLRNETGHCTLLHVCPQIHYLLSSADIFAQHSCILKNEFAGVCCPYRF